jgi:hypothetical protein
MLGDEFLQTIEVMTMTEKLAEQMEKYYTPEQLKYFEERREAGGPEMEEATQKGPQMWADLFADVEAVMAAGVPPVGPRAQELAKRRLCDMAH